MDASQPNTTLLMQDAWKRAKARFPNYFIILLQFMVLPVIIAALVTLAATITIPFVISQFRDPTANQSVQFISAAAAIILPVLAIIGAVYRNLVGTLALNKIIIDADNDRKKTTGESKALLTPYINFLTLMTIVNLGYYVYFPVSIVIGLFFMPIWSQFAMFSFVTDNRRGGRNIWKAIQMYRENFFMVTGHAVVILIFGAVFANIGNVVLSILKLKLSVSSAVTVLGVQALGIVFTFLFQIFSISYMYELYKKLDDPKEVKIPYMFIFFSVLGWLIALSAVAWGIQYLATHPITLPQFKTVPRLDY